MSATGTDIRLGAAPNATRGLVAALVFVTLAVGILIGREIGVGIDTTSRPVATETAISTTWLAETPAVRTEVMRAMNGFAAATAAPSVESSSVRNDVMRHMNELSSQPTGRALTAIRVMRYMNELSARRS